MKRMTATDASLNRCQLLHLLHFGQLSLFFIGMPVLDPHEEAFLFVVHHAVDFPVEVCQPLYFHHVQLLDRDAADLSPRSILEGVVIEKFAAEEETRSEHTIHGTGRRSRLASLVQLLHARC